jgi:hypothetical protein
MTKLIVTPIDMTAKGSWAKRRKLLHALRDLSSGELSRIVDAMDAVEDLVGANLETDDGTTVAEALEMCSAADYDALIAGLLGGETVKNPRSAS